MSNAMAELTLSASWSVQRFASPPPWFPPVPEINPPISNLFFEFQIFRRNLCDYGLHTLDLCLVPRLHIIFTRRALRIPLQRYRRAAVGHRPPPVEHRWRQRMAPTYRAHRH